MHRSVISKVCIAVVGLVYIIKGILNLYHYTKYTIPQQLVQLVKQAHMEQQFQTMWNIEVSDAMRDALRAPLTVQQLEAIFHAKNDITSKSVNCYVVSHKYRGNELSGIVNVSVDILSRSGLHDYHISNVKLQISVSSISNNAQIDHKWFVSSVKQL